MRGILSVIKNNRPPSDRMAYDQAEKNAKRNQLGLWDEKKTNRTLEMA